MHKNETSQNLYRPSIMKQYSEDVYNALKSEKFLVQRVKHLMIEDIQREQLKTCQSGRKSLRKERNLLCYVIFHLGTQFTFLEFICICVRVLFVKHPTMPVVNKNSSHDFTACMDRKMCGAARWRKIITMTCWWPLVSQRLLSWLTAQGWPQIAGRISRQ